MGWNVGIAVIVIVGIVLVVLTIAGRTSPSKGRGIGAHWHAALGVNVCGQWAPNPPQTPRLERAGEPGVYAGLHTHADGLIHFEPQTSDDTGDSATVGRYFGYNGWSLSDSSFTFSGVKEKNGDSCTDANGQSSGKGTVEWAVNGKRKTGDPAHYAPKDQDKVVIAFLPKGGDVVKLGDPPSTKNLPRAPGISETGAPVSGGQQPTITVPPSSPSPPAGGVPPAGGSTPPPSTP